MADFSTISNMLITSATKVVPDDGRELRHAEGGEIRGRSAFYEPVFNITVVVRGDVAVKQALETFYETYTNDMNTIVIDDSEYSAMFVNRPYVTSKNGDIRYIQFNLIGFEEVVTA